MSICIEEIYRIFYTSEICKVNNSERLSGTITCSSQISSDGIRAIGTTFQNKTTIRVFKELHHFTGVSSFEAYAFNGCTNLVELIVPGTVKRFVNDCFQNCTNLVSLTIEEGLTTCGNTTRMFAYDNKLKCLVFPTTLTSFGNFGFWAYCNVKWPVVFKSTTPVSGKTMTDSNVAGTIYVPDIALSAYQTAWSYTGTKLKPLSQCPVDI